MPLHAAADHVAFLVTGHVCTRDGVELDRSTMSEWVG